jgi:phosphatidylserine/phosphatidylglycerophosphate/cardiolipin synthase-like enzyme
LLLSACVASAALAVAWAERGLQNEDATAEGVHVDGPEAHIHYAPRENLESVDAREIGRARLSIDMAAYVLSDPQVIAALVEAAERGVVIRLYFDKSQFAEHGPTRGGPLEALLAHSNVAARVKGEGVLMHLKAYAVDGEVLRTGSGNFSRSGLAAQDNDLVFIADQVTVDAFENNFERIWARAQNVGALDAIR